MRLKVCGLNNPDNIKNVVSLNPDYIGFIFYPESKRYIANCISSDMLSNLSDNVKKVGVFVNEDINLLETIFKQYKLDLVQLHGDESPEYCAELCLKSIPIIKAFSIDESFDFNQLEEYYNLVSYFLFDTKGKFRGGNGVKFNWDLINNYKLEIPFFLSGGIDLEDAEAINQISFKYFHAIDINSKFETEPGLKNIAKIKKFKSKILLQHEH